MMHDPLHKKQMETSQEGGTSQKAAPTKPPVQRVVAHKNSSVHSQVWGHRIPADLRLSKTELNQQEQTSESVKPVQRKEHTTGLPLPLKQGIEHLSGLSLDDVHVHYHSAQPAKVQALAYTQGTEIYVGAGQEQHLAHEAWHAVQQKQERVHPTIQAKGLPLNDDLLLEREADVMGAKALQAATSSLGISPQLPTGEQLRPTATRRGAIQRIKIEGDFQQTSSYKAEELSPTLRSAILSQIGETDFHDAGSIVKIISIIEDNQTSEISVEITQDEYYTLIKMVAREEKSQEESEKEKKPTSPSQKGKTIKVKEEHKELKKTESLTSKQNDTIKAILRPKGEEIPTVLATETGIRTIRDALGKAVETKLQEFDKRREVAENAAIAIGPKGTYYNVLQLAIQRVLSKYGASIKEAQQEAQPDTASFLARGRTSQHPMPDGRRISKASLTRSGKWHLSPCDTFSIQIKAYNKPLRVLLKHGKTRTKAWQNSTNSSRFRKVYILPTRKP